MSGDGAPAAQEIAALYDRRAASYDLAQWLWERIVFRGCRRRLIREARGRVLEVGIGTGANLYHYARSCPVVGVDLSGRMLRRALALAYRLEMYVEVETMDGEALRYPDRTFDTVVSTLTLCTTPDPLRLLREMARVCRPGGRILLLDHGQSTSAAVNWWLHRLEPGHLSRHACHLTRDVAALPAQAGLRIAHQDRQWYGVLTLTEAAPAGA